MVLMTKVGRPVWVLQNLPKKNRRKCRLPPEMSSSAENVVFLQKKGARGPIPSSLTIFSVALTSKH